MSLVARCRDSLSSKLISAGELCYIEGNVEFDVVRQNQAFAFVGEKRSNWVHNVELDWRFAADGILGVACDCREFDRDEICKHIWATIVKFDAVGYSDRVPGNHSLDILSVAHEEMFVDEPFSQSGEFGFQDAHSPSFLTKTYSPPKRKSKKNKASVPIWQTQLSMIRRYSSDDSSDAANFWEQSSPKRCETWYVLDLGQSVSGDALIIEFHQRETKKNGEWGKLKKRAVRTEQIGGLDEDERKLVSILISQRGAESDFGYGGYQRWGSYSYCQIDPSIYDIVLPRLCATGRFVWLLDTTLPVEEATQLAWDDGPPWQFQIDVTTDEKRKCWKLSGQLVRDGESVKLTEIVTLTGDGLVMFSDRLASYNDAKDFPWVAALRNSEIEVPFRDRDRLMQWMCTQPHIPAANLPEALRPPEQTASPVGHVSIVTPPITYSKQRNMFAKVEFEYEGRIVKIGDDQHSHFDQEKNQIVRRDIDAERQLLSRLQSLSVRPTDGYDKNYADVKFPEKQFMKLVKNLTNDGWTIAAQDGTRIRRPGAFSMSVTTGVDWFELDGNVDFDGQTVSLPSLLSALKSGDDYVLLDDGSKGMLPEEWLEKYGRLAQLGEAEGGSLRFASSQALLLDAMLAEQENVDVDKQFEQFRKKLRSFEGVNPRNEPRGFHGELREYQREGLGWLRFLQDYRFGGCLADDMGLGKTVQVLALLQEKRLRGVSNGKARLPSIVVVPKSLVFNWIDEAKRFTPKLRLFDYTGTDRSGMLDRLDECDLLVTTYGTLRRDVAKLKDIAFEYAILDEAQAIKNHNSQSAKACRLLNAKHRLIMTGTPVENHLGELWSLFEFLNPGMLGRSTAFNALSKNGRNGDDGSIKLIGQALRPFMLRRTKEQVLTELPDKTEQTLYCEMSSKQRKEYNELRDYYREQLSKKVKQQGLKKSKIHVLEALLRLRQAACHPGLLDKKKQDAASAKLETLLEQIAEVQQEGHKALVFSQFTSLLSIVRRHLEQEKINYEYLDGRTRKRADRVKRFQEDPDCRLFLISLKAGGHGLNLTAADYVFILDPWWNPAAEAQAVDRAHRIGQTRRVFAYRLICRDTVEDKILELQKSKRELADAIISADNSLISSLTSDDLQLLLS